MQILGRVKSCKMYKLQSILIRNAGRSRAGPGDGAASKAIKTRLLRKQFLRGVYLTEASEGPGAARWALSGGCLRGSQRALGRSGALRGLS